MAGCKRSSISITCVLVLLFLYIYKTTTNTICATDIAHHSDFNFPLTKKTRNFPPCYVQTFTVSYGKSHSVLFQIYIKKLCACTDPFLFSPFKHKKFYENFPFFLPYAREFKQKLFSSLFYCSRFFSSSSLSGGKVFGNRKKKEQHRLPVAAQNDFNKSLKEIFLRFSQSLQFSRLLLY